MTPYQLIACDLDGTLLNSASEISSENLAAIHTLAGMGVHFVPCTGRTVAEFPEAIRMNPDIRYIIYTNGTAILDRASGEKIMMGIPVPLVREVLDILNSYETYITVRCGGECIIDAGKHTPDKLRYYNVWDLHSELVGKVARRMEDLDAFVSSSDQVEDFSVFFRSDDEREACRTRLLATGKLRLAEACAHNLEIFSMNAGKGNALHLLSDRLGIDHAATIGVGDSDNDMTMLKAAGLGLAVANSCDSLKAAADAVICTNDEHAIAYILKHYFH